MTDNIKDMELIRLFGYGLFGQDHVSGKGGLV